jgi:hypothetical protein
MKNPHSTQECMYCEGSALYSLIYMEGKKYIPTCANHETVARAEIRDYGSGVDDVIECAIAPFGSPGAPMPTAIESRMHSAHQKAPPRHTAPGPESNFGQRVGGRRQGAVLTEAAPQVMRSTDQGYVDKAIARVWGNQPLRYTDKDYVDKAVNRTKKKREKQKAKTVLQALGGDWTTLRARKIQGGTRIDMLIDGDRWTIYSRKG